MCVRIVITPNHVLFCVYDAVDIFHLNFTRERERKAELIPLHMQIMCPCIDSHNKHD